MADHTSHVVARWCVCGVARLDDGTRCYACDCDPDAFAEEDEQFGFTPADTWLSSERCPACGRSWSPSMNGSETFPGSACDLGQCTLALGDRG